MKTAFVIFNGMTALDFVGIYDPLTRLKTMGFMSDFEWNICAMEPEVSDDLKLRLKPDMVRPSLEGFDMLVVPGGFGTRTLCRDTAFIDWLKTSEPVELKISVCTGSLLLGAAGFLKNKRATTHPKALSELEAFCSDVVRERIVDEGTIITGGGVASAIDLGLYMVKRMAGSEAKEKIAEQMDYPYV